MGACQCQCRACQCKECWHEAPVDPRHQDVHVESSQESCAHFTEEEICHRHSIVESHPVLEPPSCEDDLVVLREASTEALRSLKTRTVNLDEDVVIFEHAQSEVQEPIGGSASWSVMEIVNSISTSGFIRSMSQLPTSLTDPDYKPAGMRPVKISSNHNRPCDYDWLQDVLVKLSRNETRSLGCGDADTSESLLPLFFVMGACPNVLCGMQVVMYSRSAKGLIDFWWVKPAKAKSSCGEAGGSAGVERESLKRHGKGPYKNDPGRSMAFYKPLAALFENASMASGWRFGIEEVYCELDGAKVPRAYMQPVSPEAGDDKKLYVYLFWQEDWTMNPFARQKYVKGKMVYQKQLAASPPLFFSRQYEIVNDSFSIQNFEEPPVSSYLPPECLKTLWEPDVETWPSNAKSMFRGAWR